jgi:hypothetical protein
MFWFTEAFAGEYDIQPCAPGTSPADCVYIITSRFQTHQMLACDPMVSSCTITENGVHLLYANGHCHAPSCISLELYNADTGQLICRQTPVYGTGEKFSEPGYLNTIPPCLWGNEDGLQAPPHLYSYTNLLSIKKNNNTLGHYGEMAQWFILFSPQ